MVNITFKQKLIEFLIDDWANESKVSFLRTRDKNLTLYVNYDKCYKFSAVEDRRGGYYVYREVVDSLTSNQVEADTKIILHVCNYNAISPTSVLIKASDTDIFTIMLGNMHNMTNPNHKVFMQLGAANTTRIVNLSEIHKKIGEEVCKSLPGLHPFTGCDFIPSFYRKGKTSSFKNMCSSAPYQNAFMKLGDLDNLLNNAIFETCGDIHVPTHTYILELHANMELRALVPNLATRPGRQHLPDALLYHGSIVQIYARSSNCIN